MHNNNDDNFYNIAYNLLYDLLKNIIKSVSTVEIFWWYVVTS